MKRIIATSTFAIVLVLFVVSGAALACPCGLPELGTPPSNIGGDRIYNLVNASVVVLNNTCYAMYAGGGAAPKEPFWQWRLFVKKKTSDNPSWEYTGGGDHWLNSNPNEVTNPYFYEMQLVVFQSHVYAVFAETDGDGNSNGNGHKVIRVKRYDEAADTWTFVDFDPVRPERNPQLGLSREFWPGADEWHWSYINPQVLATADGLYVAWTEYSPVNGAANGLTVIKKYDGAAWTTLPRTGLPDLYKGDNSPVGLVERSLTLGQYQGKLVLGWNWFFYQDQVPFQALRVSIYDDTSHTWSQISPNWVNVDVKTSAGSGQFVEHEGKLYVLFAENTFYPATGTSGPPLRLFVKRFDGKDPVTLKWTWTLVGGGAVRSSATVTNPILVNDDDGVTVVSWDAQELHVDRFDGTAWQTIGTSGEGNVVAPYTYYMYAPSISATSQNGDVVLNWHANDGNPGLLLSAYID
jgi:hypothetical protein